MGQYVFFLLIYKLLDSDLHLVLILKFPLWTTGHLSVCTLMPFHLVNNVISLSVFGFVRLNVLVLLLFHLLTLNDILLHLTIINEVSTSSFCLQCTFFSSGFFSCYGFHIDREDNASISFPSLAEQHDHHCIF